MIKIWGNIPGHEGYLANNRLTNLEWVTNQENVDHAIETGLVRSVKSKEERIKARLTITNRSPIEEVLSKTRRRVSQIDIKTNECIKTWDSIFQAGETLKISRQGISNCLAGRRNKYKNFKWVYA